MKKKTKKKPLKRPKTYKKKTVVTPAKKKKKVVKVKKKSTPKVESYWDQLNLQQRIFCKLYASSKEYFGNGVQSYIEAYDIDTSKKGYYKVVCICASQLLSIPKVYGYINELLKKAGLNDQNVDKQMLFLIEQHTELGQKMAAIREYNKLKQRITDKSEVELTNVARVVILPPKKKKGER